MLKQLRQRFTQQLWENYCEHSADCRLIADRLQTKGAKKLLLDHFAVIDLPSLHSGIPTLQRLFELMGYVLRGRDYLASKQNDFAWLAEQDCLSHEAQTVLPQIVVADFRLEEMPAAVRAIIEKYAAQTLPLNWQRLETDLRAIEKGDEIVLPSLLSYLQHYFQGRNWPLPNLQEFLTVHAFNELLAWVLVFGRRPNHFTFSVHLLVLFPDLSAFNDFIENELGLGLNQESGKIKGGAQVGIAQSATVEKKEKIKLADGEVELPISFVEFVWRYPCGENAQTPMLWRDYFTGFIPQNADRIIQSLL